MTLLTGGFLFCGALVSGIAHTELRQERVRLATIIQFDICAALAVTLPLLATAIWP